MEFLGDSAFYNIAILDYLFRTSPGDTHKMVTKLSSFGDEQRLFLQAYFSSGQYGEALVAQLTLNSPKIFRYLISTSELSLDVTIRQKLVSAALANAWSYKGLFTISAVEADFMLSNYASIGTLTLDKLEAKQIDSIVNIFKANNIRVPLLSLISESLKQEFINNHLYELNIDNLRVAVGIDENLSLDMLHSLNINVYNNVVAKLSAYLDLIEGIAPTVASNSNFISILEHVHEEVPEQLDRVLTRASNLCLIKDLNQIDQDIWSCLAKHLRFPPSFKNVFAYITLFDGVDANLAKILLDSEQITEINLGNEEDKKRVAICILSESKELPSASLRVRLAVSLCLENYIDVDDLPSESGDFFALLVDANNFVIEDCLETYQSISHMDWQTKEAFIDKSEKFVSYIDALSAGDMARLLGSQKININNKLAVVARADDFRDGFDTEDLNQLLKFAVGNSCSLSIDVLGSAASAGVSPDLVVTLLEPHLLGISDVELTDILIALGENYEALTKLGADRPKLPNNHLHRKLLERLKKLQIVSTYVESDDYIRVNKKRT